MGKLGGRELNVSSDIDLIFVYEDDGETAGGQRAPLATQEFFTRLGKRLIGALAEVTQDGYVFRVDMRLRPNGDSGPLVCSLGMLEEYFYVQGREWERYAWIKGRLVSEGASAAAQRLAEAARRDRDAVRLPPLSRLRRDQRRSARCICRFARKRSGARRCAPTRPTTSSSGAAASARSSSARRCSS